MAIESINPATGQQLEAFAPFRPEHVHALLDEAREAYLHWRQETFAARSERLTALAKVLRSRKAELARTATLEMGKSILEAEAEVEKCAWCCDFFAQHAEGYLADQQLPSTASESYVGCRPLGVVLAIMPWNFPYWQVFRFAAPALMAGNTAVLKHASNVSRCALEVERAFVDAGFPHGIFRTLLLPGAETAELIGDPRIAAVTLTGSTQAGSAAAAASGRQIKKHVLELGGSDAFIVLEDADIEAAAAVGVRARYQNCGQSCIAAKRFILAERIADQFLQAFTTGVRALRVGDPLDRAVQVGPLARADLRDALERQVQESVSAGATLALGGHCVPGPGAFYEPTILTGVEPGMPAFDEETFGPAAAMVIARDAGHAVELANNSDYGLGGNLWTRDIDRARELAKSLECGALFINGMTASEPGLPFGGVKHSGYGRELSAYGIREFVNLQTVWIGPPTPAPRRAPTTE